MQTSSRGELHYPSRLGHQGRRHRPYRFQRQFPERHGGAAEINVTFNSALNTNNVNCPGGGGFHYGLDGNAPPGGMPDAFSRNHATVLSGDNKDRLRMYAPATFVSGSSVTISKSMDAASANLAQFAINGNSLGGCQICLTNGVSANGSPACYLQYKLDRAFVKSWSTSGDADDRPTEEVAFYYNRIAFAYLSDDGEENLSEESMSWDKVKNRLWTEGLRGIFDILTGSPPPLEPPQ